jgi:excisionase family DNA binding protein
MSDRALSPKQIAERYGVGIHTVLTWIANHELEALNVGRSPGKKKARWKSLPEHLAAFELRRLSSPAAPRTRRRKQATAGGVIEFYK